MNYSENYLKVGTIVYPPKLTQYRNLFMLTPDQKTEVAKLTNDSALRLYEFFITKKSWKHFNPTDYERIGKVLGWTARKTESNKTLLTKANYLLIKKDTLKDSTKIYRVLLGKPIIEHYNETNEFPSDTEAFTYRED